MSDGALRISILGDASQFKDTLADLQKRLEKFKEDLKTATGLDVPRINFEINGIETSIKQITEFGKFAEGSLGFYKQLKRELEDQLNVTTNRAEQEQLVKRLSDVSNIIKDIKSAGIEKPIPVPIVIEPPTPGSIADIKRQISETIKEKEVAIGVNLTNANVKLQGLRNELSVLEKQGIEIEAKPITPVLENSIQGIKNRIDELNAKKVLIDIDDKVSLATINRELDDLNSQLVKANSTSFDKDGKITANSNKAGRALTSLSLIAQDLPFGFIAIQNNIPALAESFGQLKNQSGGFKGALKELGGALSGPVGISFAIATLVSGLTVLVQKYGSLSAAITSVLNLTKTQRDLNVELATATAKNIGNAEAEITVLKTLTSVLTNDILSLNARNGAYDELNKKYPGLLTNLDQEKLKIGQLNKELAERLLLFTKQIQLNGQRAALEKLIAEEAEKSFKSIAQFQNQTFLDGLTSELMGVLKGFNAGTAGLQDFSQGLSNGAKSTAFYNERLSETQTELSGIDGQILAIVEAGKKKQKQDEEAAKAAKKLSKTFIPTIDSQALDEAFNLDKIIANLTKYGNALIDVNNTEKERKNALKELLEINPEYFKSFDLNKKRIDELRGRLESYIRTLLVEKKAREDSAAASKYNAEFRKNEEKGIKRLGDKYDLFADSVNSIPKDIDTAIQLSMQFDEIGNSTKKATQANNKFIESLKLGQDVIEILQKGLNLKETYNNAIEDLLNFSEYSRKEIEKIAKDLRFLQEPLEGLFTTLLEDGKVSWKSFADDVIKQIKRIAAALLSKAIIQGIANILAPGSGAIVGQGLKAIDTAALEDYANGNDWVDLLTGGQGRANYGMIRGERAMAMSGQVNMVIRGNDLVGVMNRTNTTINRVG